MVWLRGKWLGCVAMAVGSVAACSSGDAPTGPAASSTGSSQKGDPVDVPIDGVSAAQVRVFQGGDDLFGLPFREVDGLGPLYIRTSCGACHAEAGRGPGFVLKMAVVDGDGVTASSDQSKLAFGHTIRPYVAADARTPIVALVANDVRVSERVGPPVIGRGYVEAVLDSEIQRLEQEQAARTDGIHGRINWVTYASLANAQPGYPTYEKGQRVIGRFGVKARVATLDDFAADALQGDMGITTPMRPDEPPNPDGVVDDRKAGVDIGLDAVASLAGYMRLIAIPRRPAPDARGAALFDRAKCSACHVPALKTRADHPMAVLAGIDAPIFSDLLLHDMGDGLADGMTDGIATSREWRTAPLIGLRFATHFLHDGRAHSVEEAIQLHGSNGSQAAESQKIFDALSGGDRAALLDYVGAL